MDKEKLKKLQGEWTKENYPFGIALGYPKCCVIEFCAYPPEYLKSKSFKPNKAHAMKLKASYINGSYSGLIPCYNHAKLILDGKIKLTDLIKNRSKEFPPFPNL